MTSPAPQLSKIVLGSAQFGMDYGIAATKGRPSDSALTEILDAAWASGVRTIDTARDYGDAERRIGRWMAATGNEFAVVSKLPRVPDFDALATARFVRTQVLASCEALGRDSIEGYLCHHAPDLLRAGVAEELRALVGEGRLRSFGSSAYEPDIVRAMLRVEGLGLVQIPLNLFNRAMIDEGALGACADRGVRVFARSVFVQGLLLMDPDRLPRHLSAARPALLRLGSLARGAGVNIAILALCAVRDIEGVSAVVVGVDTADHLRADLALAGHSMLDRSLVEAAFRAAADIPFEVGRPQFWSELARASSAQSGTRTSHIHPEK
jgi:aryl-alcohol dehydrogenase-like predicted oxidoreductase